MTNSIPRRGMRSMRSRTSRRATDSMKSPDLYLRLASLEIERSRRVAELDALAERKNQTTERIRLIVAEQEALRNRILAMTQVANPQVENQQRELPKQNTNSIGFTY